MSVRVTGTTMGGCAGHGVVGSRWGGVSVEEAFLFLNRDRLRVSVEETFLFLDWDRLRVAVEEAFAGFRLRGADWLRLSCGSKERHVEVDFIV